MANHKYKNRKQQRAGCQMCKPQKTGGMNADKELGHEGFGKIKKLVHAKEDQDGWKNDNRYTILTDPT